MTADFDFDKIDGFDPLAGLERENPKVHKLIEDSTKRDVLNIIRSYTGQFDCISEAIQNALDAVEKRHKEEPSYDPRIWIRIDTKELTIRVVDNGIGMTRDQFLFCLRPNVSFKERNVTRGHKGVGATFLAYGFSYLRLPGLSS